MEHKWELFEERPGVGYMFYCQRCRSWLPTQNPSGPTLEDYTLMDELGVMLITPDCDLELVALLMEE